MISWRIKINIFIVSSGKLKTWTSGKDRKVKDVAVEGVKGIKMIANIYSIQWKCKCRKNDFQGKHKNVTSQFKKSASCR